ncbi:MAG: hypothetical protein ACLFNX_11880 [Spirochaetaceae bacterium]
MEEIIDSRTGLSVGRPAEDPLGPEVPVDSESLAEARSGLIVSGSGWRAVFAADGHEHSPAADIAPANRELLALAGCAYARYLTSRLAVGADTVLVAADSRPTGPAIASVILRALLGEGLKVRYLFIAPIPEVIAYAASSEDVGAFAYISASHNPLGYNGLKFGIAGEGVLPAAEAAEVAREFESLCGDSDARLRCVRAVRSVGEDSVRQAFVEVERYKTQSTVSYRRFLTIVADGPLARNSAETTLREGIKAAGCGIVVDFNGSARSTSVDLSLLSELGIRTHAVNAAAGKIVHQILPEGEGLATARAELAHAASADDRFTLAYVPDNDGDRGNLVFAGAGTPPDAQEVFALAVLAELAWLTRGGLAPSDDHPWAVVVNGPTSLRVERIAAAFGAEVHRCEVGEANVVETADRLRNAGYLVRILGEGSTGGSIVHPSRVRDPMATIFAFLKLLYAGRHGGGDLFEIWCRRSGNTAAYRGDFTLEDVRHTLPRFHTTSTGEPEAKLNVRTRDYERLKARYAEVFAEDWSTGPPEALQKLGVLDYEELRYEGTRTRHLPHPGGTDDRPGGAIHDRPGGATEAPAQGGSGPGGLKMQLYDAAGRAVGFLWMRGSGTEPVFRAIVDVEGDSREIEKKLLAWHRDMISRADERAVRRTAEDGAR